MEYSRFGFLYVISFIFLNEQYNTIGINKKRTLKIYSRHYFIFVFYKQKKGDYLKNIVVMSLAPREPFHT